MRTFFLLPVICLVGNSSHVIISGSRQADTTIVAHLLDGNTAEWPLEKFHTDKATKIEYAVDNDNQALFLAINVREQAIQKRIMQEGLNLYIDTKGKKKESKGIEFPAKMENLASIENMKLFGFTASEPVTQSLRTEGSINIAIGWDSAFVMHIEYTIPLKMLEETVADLNKKKISIGWKLEQSQTPGITNQVVTTTTRVVGVPSGSRPSGSRGVSNVNNNPELRSTTDRAQSVWTSHTIIF